MDWTPGLERAYDRDIGRAFKVSATTDSCDWPLLQTVQANRARFVSIEPINMAIQTRWARDFVASQPSGVEHDALTDAFRAARPLQEFTRKVRTLQCSREWYAFRNERVATVIKEWAQKHGFTVDPLMPVPVGAHPGSAAPRAQVSSTSAERRKTAAAIHSAMHMRTFTEIDMDTLRVRAHELIDRMTAEELLALPLNLGMLYRR
jgi:hypothetical protein